MVGTYVVERKYEPNVPIGNEFMKSCSSTSRITQAPACFIASSGGRRESRLTSPTGSVL